MSNALSLTSAPQSVVRRALLCGAALCGVLLCGTSAQAQPSALPGTIARVKPAVVIVGSYNPTGAPRFSLRGTGFVVGAGNWVVSNAHVLQQSGSADTAGQLVVQVRTGPDTFQTRLAQVLDKDVFHDLALLHIDGPPVPVLLLGDSDRIKEGQELAFMGFLIGGALGFSSVTHRAMVSSITQARLPSARGSQLNAEAIRGLREGNFQIFQLDATAYPGNSGGPLFDAVSGEVVGVMNMVLLKGTRESALSQPSGISYAIPARHVRDMLARRVGSAELPLKAEHAQGPEGQSQQ